ncbi:MAG TPA: GAF domain-containing protein, partial [Oligoflexia bacterium]|nr:GAF domain-containing protein [Oligoflexia bacterium]
MEGLDASLAASIVDSIVTTLDLRRLFAQTAEKLGMGLGADRVIIFLAAQENALKQPPIEWSAEDSDPGQDSELLAFCSYIQRLTYPLPRAIAVHEPADDPLFGAAGGHCRLLDITSVLAVTTRSHGIPNATIVLWRKSGKAPWHEEDTRVLEYVAHFFGIAVENCFASASCTPQVGAGTAESLLDAPPVAATGPEKLEERAVSSGAVSAQALYRRLVDNSDAVIFHVDAGHVVRFISRRSVELFGVQPEDLASGTDVCWYDLVHFEDRERVKQKALEATEKAQNFEEEFRVVHHLSGKERWLLAKFVPVFADRAELIGWDGFAIDITSRREARLALDAQSKKVRALYTVSSAIRGYLDPANIAARGLGALCEATGADAGLCYLYPSRESDKLALVSHHGFSVNFTQKSEMIASLESLSTYVSEHGQSVVVPDMKSDPRCSRILAEEEGVRSSVLVPVSVEEETLGTIALFHRHVAQFDGGDVMLVAAAANQIGLAARQANLFAAYRRQ